MPPLGPIQPLAYNGCKIYAMANGSEAERQLIRQAIRKGGLDDLPKVLDIVKASGAIEYTMTKAKEQAQIARDLLTCLPGSEHRKALELLTEVAVARVS